MQLPLSQRHAFLSYMHEDKIHVDELQEALEAAGIQVWRDTQALWPGEDWQMKIRAAIETDSLAFIACFSTSADQREKSYQYEELTLAVEQYRLRPPDSSWLFTVRFDDCMVPAFDLGAGRALDKTIQRTDLFGSGKTVQTVRLSQAVGRVVNPQGNASASTEAVADAKKASSSARGRADALKQLLRDPNADIALEDFMATIAVELREKFSDATTFPTIAEDKAWVAFSSVWFAQVRAYETSLEPALDMIRLAAMYGKVQHNPAWERFMSQLTPLIVMDDGIPALLHLRAYPSLVLMYVATISSSSRRNFVPMLGLVTSPSVRDRFDSTKAIRLPRFTNVRAVAEGAEPLASALALSDDGTEVTPELIAGLAEKKIGGPHTPMSDHLHSLLRELFRDELADDRDYADAFDRAEVMLDAIAADTSKQSGWAGGFGRYTWRHKHAADPVEVQMLKELTEQREGWGPLLDGLFGRSVDRAISAFESVKETAEMVRRQQW